MIRLSVQLAGAAAAVECESVDEAVALLRGLAAQRDQETTLTLAPPVKRAPETNPAAGTAAPQPPAAIGHWDDAASYLRHQEAASKAKPPAPEKLASKRDRAPGYNADLFAQAWNAADHIDEIAKMFGITPNAANLRAMKLRAEGRALKRFSKSNRRHRATTPQPRAQDADDAETPALRFDESTRTLHFPDGTTKVFGSIAAGRAYAESEAARLGQDLSIDDPDGDDD